MTNKFFSDFLCLSSQVVYLDTPNKTSQDSPEVCYYANKAFRVTPSYPVISRRQDPDLLISCGTRETECILFQVSPNLG